MVMVMVMVMVMEKTIVFSLIIANFTHKCLVINKSYHQKILNGYFSDIIPQTELETKQKTKNQNKTQILIHELNETSTSPTTHTTATSHITQATIII